MLVEVLDLHRQIIEQSGGSMGILERDAFTNWLRQDVKSIS